MPAKRANLLGETFGLLRGRIKKPTDKIMREIDKELWGIEPKLSKKTRDAIEKAKERIRKGKFVTESDARKRLKL